MKGELVLLNLLGGMALLLYGMRLAGEGIQSLARTRLRVMLGKLASHRLVGMGVGALTTALLQSSSVTTVMLVGFVSAGYIGLRESLAVILGADIGTTLTVQLIAFNILDYSVLLVAIGATMVLATKQRRYEYTGRVILGFGLVFLALKLITDATNPLKHNEVWQEVLLGLGSLPLLVMALATFFTALIHSSAGTIGLMLGFASQGLVPLEMALPIVFGANLGTCATALLSSLGATTDARRVAVAHTLLKVAGIAIFYPLMTPFSHLVSLTSSNTLRQIANAHTLFNLGIGILGLPLIGPFAQLICWLVPEEREAEGAFKLRYLNQHMLDTPALAIGQATRETLRMADIVQGMLRDALLVLETDDEQLLEDVHRRDDQVDFLEEEIKRYLTRLSQQSLTLELSLREIGLLYVINDLENIGDVVDTGLMVELARKKIEERLTFSQEGRAEIRDMHAQVSENLELALSAFATHNVGLAEEVIRRKADINRIERDLRQSHIRRLHRGLTESMETSPIHLDLLTELKRINSHATNIAYVVRGEL